MLRLEGPDFYDKGVNHEVPFNDPKVASMTPRSPRSSTRSVHPEEPQVRQRRPGWRHGHRVDHVPGRRPADRPGRRRQREVLPAPPGLVLRLQLPGGHTRLRERRRVGLLLPVDGRLEQACLPPVSSSPPSPTGPRAPALEHNVTPSPSNGHGVTLCPLGVGGMPLKRADGGHIQSLVTPGRGRAGLPPSGCGRRMRPNGMPVHRVRQRVDVHERLPADPRPFVRRQNHVQIVDVVRARGPATIAVSFGTEPAETTRLVPSITVPWRTTRAMRAGQRGLSPCTSRQHSAGPRIEGKRFQEVWPSDQPDAGPRPCQSRSAGGDPLHHSTITSA
jgi:hypothetical protein